MRRQIIVMLVVCALQGVRPVEAAELAPLFSTTKPLVMDLSADLQAFCDKPDEDDCPDVPAVIVYRDGDENRHEIETRLRIRGRWQADTADCTLPALFLVSSREATIGTVFEHQEMLTLTTHCRTSASYEQYLLKEYLAYRIYNLLTNKSLKVRLAHITYHDTSGRSETIERYGFFTEHFRSLAERFSADVWAPDDRFDEREADPIEMATLTLFEYMIGNTDWSVVAGHNIVYVRGADWVTAVPFDLDFSGLVDAAYAGPPPGLGLSSVRERTYRGFCRPDNDWPAVFEHFMRLHPDVLDLVAEIPGLKRYQARRTTAYLESFFKILDSPKRRERRIVRTCRNP
jgi:hypothetical protein